jgi:hypothetical protein
MYTAGGPRGSPRYTCGRGRGLRTRLAGTGYPGQSRLASTGSSGPPGVERLSRLLVHDGLLKQPGRPSR